MTNSIVSNNIVFELGKRERYIEAWLFMYKNDKKTFNEKMYDGVNPSENKNPLKTEINNFAVIAYDISIQNDEIKNHNFPGIPIGIFSMLITTRKNIGKQFIVHKNYQGQGIGTALLLILENELKKNGQEKYYIGCSSMSARILKKLGNETFSDDDIHDLHKFNVDLNRHEFDSQYKKYVLDRFKIV